jgi:large subunit ribosomal protein L18
MYADKSKARRQARNARHERIRKRASGTAERPRFCVRRSLNNIYAQIVDDTTGRSLLQVSSLAPELRDAEGAKTAVSAALGKLIAERALEKGIKKVVFDRGGYLYHGRVKAVAEAAREAGLEF